MSFLMRWIGLVGIVRFSKKFALKALLYVFTGLVNSVVFIFIKLSEFLMFKRFLKTYFLLGIVAFLVFLLLVGGYAYHIWRVDINLDKLREYRPILSSQLLDRNGNLVTEFAKERRIFTPIDKIPKHLILAFIAAEDRTFYSNPGIDLPGLARAMTMNIYHFLSGKKLHGASTITQQVVRNTILSNERTITRKVKEMIISYKISKIMTKDQLMEIYLNQIYLGSRSYGVAAAAQEYFGKDIADLSLPESALIASLTKAPSTLDPRKGKKHTIARRNWILESMKEEGYITREEMQIAIDSPIALIDKKTIKKPYSYIEYVVDEMQKQRGISLEALEQDGYRIKTAIDPQIYSSVYKHFNSGIVAYDRRHGYAGAIAKCEKISEYKSFLDSFDVPENIGDYILAVVLDVDDNQAKIGIEKGVEGVIDFQSAKWARPRLENLDVGKEPKSLRDILSVGDVIAVSRIDVNKFALEQIPQVNGAAVVLNHKTGEVVAMIGGYLDQPGAFNRAHQALRQPGSVAKPFAYLAALEKGFKPNDLIVDSDISLAAGDGTAWMPKNDSKSHHGAITVRRALEKSLNVPLARMMYDVGMSRLPEVLSRLDVAKDVSPVLSAALGSFEASVINIVKGYGVIANGGKKITLHSIINAERLEFAGRFDVTSSKTESTHEGGDIENFADVEEVLDDLSSSINSSSDPDQIIRPITAYQLLYMLQGSATRGTAANFGKVAPGMLFGKTGTTNDAKDLWFVGGSNEYVVGVYVGYDTPKSLGAKEYGGITALPIAANIMADIKNIHPIRPITPPQGIKFIDIDLETGKPARKSGKGVIKEAFKESDIIIHEDRQEETLSSIY